VNGQLQCGYHGWTYDRSGRVVRIPQYAADRPIPPDYCTPAYYCTARYGYAWVALDEPIADIPAVPEFGAPGWRTIFQFYERWATSPMRALENSFDNSHFSFVHRATFGVAAQPTPSKYELVESDTGFYAETVIPAANPARYQRISGVTDEVTTRHMRNAYFLPFSRRLDIEYPSGIRHIIINCFTPIDDGHIQLCQWLFRNDTEADCPAQMLIDFDEEITREDKDILESTDPDAVIDTRRRGVEYSMDSDRPGTLIRKKLLELLGRLGEREIHRGNAGEHAVIPIQAAA
jgi:phenylpropionate dioxygenase-like ring-hydroxylating dioxygenase large terminal subunit